MSCGFFPASGCFFQHGEVVAGPGGFVLEEPVHHRGLAGRLVLPDSLGNSERCAVYPVSRSRLVSLSAVMRNGETFGGVAGKFQIVGVPQTLLVAVPAVPVLGCCWVRCGCDRQETCRQSDCRQESASEKLREAKIPHRDAILFILISRKHRKNTEPVSLRYATTHENQNIYRKTDTHAFGGRCGSITYRQAALCAAERRPRRDAGPVRLERVSPRQMGHRRIQPLESGRRHGLLGRRPPYFSVVLLRQSCRDDARGVAVFPGSRFRGSAQCHLNSGLHLRHDPRCPACLCER